MNIQFHRWFDARPLRGTILPGSRRSGLRAGDPLLSALEALRDPASRQPPGFRNAVRRYSQRLDPVPAFRSFASRKYETILCDLARLSHRDRVRLRRQLDMLLRRSGTKSPGALAARFHWMTRVPTCRSKRETTNEKRR